METKKVYLAGKIRSNGWRESIIHMRNEENLFGGEYPKSKLIEMFKHGYLPCITDYVITGPFFLACDHSCYHGEGSHGVGVNKEGCGTAYGDNFTEEEVIDVCKYQIEHSDIIFAFINDDTCYGSLFELGYAKSLGKKIIVVFDTTKRQKDMWFIANNADCVFNLEDFSVFKENKLLADTMIKSNDTSLNPIAKIFAYKIMKYYDREN